MLMIVPHNIRSYDQTGRHISSVRYGWMSYLAPRALITYNTQVVPVRQLHGTKFTDNDNTSLPKAIMEHCSITGSLYLFVFRAYSMVSVFNTR